MGYAHVADPTEVHGVFLFDLDSNGDRALLRRIAEARALSAAGLCEAPGERYVFTENVVLVKGSEAVLAVWEQWQAVDSRSDNDVAVKVEKQAVMANLSKKARRSRRRNASETKSRVLEEREFAGQHLTAHLESSSPYDDSKGMPSPSAAIPAAPSSSSYPSPEEAAWTDSQLAGPHSSDGPWAVAQGEWEDRKSISAGSGAGVGETEGAEKVAGGGGLDAGCRGADYVKREAREKQESTGREPGCALVAPEYACPILPSPCFARRLSACANDARPQKMHAHVGILLQATANRVAATCGSSIIQGTCLSWSLPRRHIIFEVGTVSTPSNDPSSTRGTPQPQRRRSCRQRSDRCCFLPIRPSGAFFHLFGTPSNRHVTPLAALSQTRPSIEQSSGLIQGEVGRIMVAGRRGLLTAGEEGGV